ncbi:hypothetical protein EV130_101849 [Rhizobium azibense]|uniref:Uncharacterized protein n=1 Tax=Rhizobium azibense TaxID=1136135 RepID=A0A4R3RWQ2_9HYPH|nr:hypothetical protein EV130_101849 [Rhizobium azibense]TCU40718.1 hypothetical protein EV129_1013 [Rhizobium azibense]
MAGIASTGSDPLVSVAASLHRLDGVAGIDRLFEGVGQALAPLPATAPTALREGWLSDISDRFSSEVLGDAQPIIDGSMGVASGHSITDPEELESPFRIAHNCLGFAGDQLLLRNFAEIGGKGF